VNNRDKPQESEDSAFLRVVDYFLGHSKPKDEPKPKKQKAAGKAKKARKRQSKS
jgi:hypothetical protein